VPGAGGEETAAASAALAAIAALLEQRPELCSGFMVRDAIIPALTAATREGVIREMVESLRGAGQVRNADTEDVVRAILRRELLASTGIGRGVAIPHTKHQGAERVLGTLAVSRPGVPFQSLDGEPVHVFALVVSPEGQSGPHLRALECVSRCLRDDQFVRSLRAAAEKR
jgi:mannitol/fructose-specific phosphotransferase system IIA component (Ntr-type)